MRFESTRKRRATYPIDMDNVVFKHHRSTSMFQQISPLDKEQSEQLCTWLSPAVGGGSRLPSYVSSCTRPAAAGGACASRGSGSARQGTSQNVTRHSHPRSACVDAFDLAAGCAGHLVRPRRCVHTDDILRPHHSVALVSQPQPCAIRTGGKQRASSSRDRQRCHNHTRVPVLSINKLLPNKTVPSNYRLQGEWDRLAISPEWIDCRHTFAPSVSPQTRLSRTNTSGAMSSWPMRSMAMMAPTSIAASLR